MSYLYILVKIYATDKDVFSLCNIDFVSFVKKRTAENTANVVTNLMSHSFTVQDVIYVTVDCLKRHFRA